MPVMPLLHRPPFADRREAGQALAAALKPVVTALGCAVPLVLALPRGGVPVAAEVARALKAPLSLLLVRKIGAPGQPELALGAVACWGSVQQTVLDRRLMAATGADAAYVHRAVARECAELERRQARYLQGRPPLVLAGRTVIVVDDGMATGATVRAALKALHAAGAGSAAQGPDVPGAVVLAIPVAPPEVLAGLAEQVEATVCLWTPSPFRAVGAHYRAFPQVSDEEVVAALDQADASGVKPGACSSG